MVFELVKDFGAVLEAMPKEHPHRRILKLLDEAVRREVHFINRHPTTLFQCLWNLCWWYDCPQAADHYVEPEFGWKQQPPWKQDVEKLHLIAQKWHDEKLLDGSGNCWLKSLRPPTLRLGTTQIAVMRGHSGIVYSVTFSSTGRWIVSGSSDKTVRIWDAHNGAVMNVLSGHEDAVQSVSFSPDEHHIVSGSSDRTVRVWNAYSGCPVAVCNGHLQAVTSVAVAPHGRQIVSGSEDGTARIWDATNGKELFVLCGHSNSVQCVAYSCDGRQIATGSQDCTVLVWDASSGVKLGALRGHSASIESVTFSPDGSRIAGGMGDSTVRVWDVNSRTQIGVFRGHDYRVNSVAFSPDSRQIASGSSDLRVWDVDSKRVEATSRAHEGLPTFYNGPFHRRGDEQMLILGHDGTVRSVAYSFDGQRIASGSEDSTVRIWDANGDSDESRLRGHELEINSISFSQDGLEIATGSFDNSARTWNANTGIELRIFRGHTPWVTCVTFSPDGNLIASGGYDGTILVWESASGLERSRRHFVRVNGVAFSPDGTRIVSGGFDAIVRVWNVQSDEECILFNGHDDEVTSVAFSLDGRQIVSGSRDNTVRVWDVDGISELAVLRGHDGRALSCGDECGVWQVALSPDAQFVASSASDNTTRMWRVADRACIKVIEGALDAAAIVAGGTTFPLVARCLVHEMIIESATNGDVVAWFPIVASQVRTHPDGHTWASAVSNKLCLFALESPVLPSENRPVSIG